MSTNVTTARSTAPAAITLPVLSDRLQRAVRAIEREATIERDYPMAPDPLPAEVRDEAAEALAAYEIQLARKVTHKGLETWFLPIMNGMTNPCTLDDLRKVLPSFHLACELIPGIALTREAQREAAQLWKFMPSSSEVYELLHRHAKPLYATRAALARAAAAPVSQTKPDTDEPITDEQRERIAQGLANLRAELVSKMQAFPEERRPQARFLSDEQLLANYEKLAAEGKPGAALRVKQLRDKLARANSVGGKF